MDFHYIAQADLKHTLLQPLQCEVIGMHLTNSYILFPLNVQSENISM